MRSLSRGRVFVTPVVVGHDAFDRDAVALGELVGTFVADRSDRNRSRQLLTAPVNQEGPTRRRMGCREQRRTRVHPDVFVVVEPDRCPAPSTQIFHP